MTEDLYYLRFKGVLSGPFQLEDIKRQIREGEISRFHQISQDRTTWKATKYFEELWQDRPVDVGTLESDEDAESEIEDDIPVAGVIEDTSQSDSPGVDWHYEMAGQSQGPISQDQMFAMIAAGQISPQTLVWTSALGNWCFAREVNVFQAYFQY